MALAEHRGAIQAILDRYQATNPRIFGSVARGDAHYDSDLDLMVDLDPAHGNPLLRVSCIAEELSILLGRRVDVVTEALLKEGVSEQANRDAVQV